MIRLYDKLRNVPRRRNTDYFGNKARIYYRCISVQCSHKWVVLEKESKSVPCPKCKTSNAAVVKVEVVQP